MRIAYVFAERDRPVLRSTGHSVHVQEMCRAFAELGHEVDVVAGVRGAENEPPAGVRIHELAPQALVRLSTRERHERRGRPSDVAAPRAGAFAHTAWRPSSVARDTSRIAWWRTWGEYFYRRSRPVLRRTRPDFVYERYVLGSSAGSRLARDLGVPLILEVNASYTFPEEWWGPHSPLYPLATRRIERRNVREASAVLAVSTLLREHCVALGAAEAGVVVMYNAADTERFRPDPGAAAAVRSRYGFARDEVVVGFIGSLKPWHGIDLLLEAVGIAARQTPAIRLLIAGDGPLRGALEARTLALGLADRTRFTGYVPREEAPAHIAAMDVATVPAPALDRFHFSPIKLFEYMAVGRAVVASSYPDMAAVVAHRESGMLVAPGDVTGLAETIGELAGDPALRTRLGAEARRSIEARHTWRHNAEEVVRRVRSLAGQ